MRQKIEETKAWQNLSHIQQKIYGKRAVILNIENQFIIATRKGVETWLQDFKPNRLIKEIILELLENDTTF